MNVWVVRVWNPDGSGAIVGIMSSYKSAIGIADDFEDGYSVISIDEFVLDSSLCYL